MPPIVEARLRRLPDRVDKRRALLDECDGQLVRACTRANAHFQIFVEQRVVAVGRLLDLEGPHSLPVQQHQQLVRTGFAQAADGPARSRGSKIWMSYSPSWAKG